MPPNANDCMAPTNVMARRVGWAQSQRTPVRTSSRRRAVTAVVRSPVSGCRIARRSAAEARKVKALSQYRLDGAITATSTPTMPGTTMSNTDIAPHTAAFASGMRSRPTSCGTAPKLAESKNTNTELATKPTMMTWATVRWPSRAAIGTEASTTALTRSHETMRRCRSTRSDSAPDTRPNSR